MSRPTNYTTSIEYPDSDEDDDFDGPWVDPWGDPYGTAETDEQEPEQPQAVADVEPATAAATAVKKTRKLWLKRHKNKPLLKPLAALSNPIGGVDDVLVPAVASYGATKLGAKACAAVAKNRHAEAVGGAAIFGGIWWLTRKINFLCKHKGAIRLGSGLAVAEIVLKNYILPAAEPVLVEETGQGGVSFID